MCTTHGDCVLIIIIQVSISKYFVCACEKGVLTGADNIYWNRSIIYLAFKRLKILVLLLLLFIWIAGI